MAIEVKDLWLRYANSPWVLRGVDLEVKPGEAVLIVGASGGGKTSLARALTGLAGTVFGAEVRGCIRICSRNLDTMSLNDVQRCIQLVNQDPYTHFLQPIPIEDFVSYAEKFYNSRAREVVEKILESLGIRDLAIKPITSLSGGQLKRLTIAKILIPDPSIVVLDEPLMWLDDIEGAEFIENIFTTLKRLGKTVIVMEHRFLKVLEYVDTVYVLRDGRIERVEELEVEPHNELQYTGGGDRDRGCIGGDKSCSDNDTVLELVDVWYRYDKASPWILRGVNLRVCRGDTVIIYGRNGQGKSTLLRIAAGVLKPIKGKRRVLADVVYIPQIPYLFITEDSILDEVRAICMSRKLGAECVEKGLGMLMEFSYRDVEKLPINLSWGQQVRLATILAYTASRGGILLLDEPFTGSTYIDSFNIARLLSSLPSAKIITVSSRDYIPLFPNAKVYILDGGTIKPFTYSDSSVFRGIDMAKKIMY